MRNILTKIYLKITTHKVKKILEIGNCFLPMTHDQSGGVGNLALPTYSEVRAFKKSVAV